MVRRFVLTINLKNEDFMARVAPLYIYIYIYIYIYRRLLKLSVENWWNDNHKEIQGEKPTSVPLGPPQLPHELA